MLAVSTLYTVNAFFRGFDNELQSLLRGSSSDATWSSRETLSNTLLDDLLKDEIWSPTIETYAMLKISGLSTFVMVKAVDPDKETRLYKNSRQISESFKNINFFDLYLENEAPADDTLLGLFRGPMDAKQGQGLLMGEPLAEQLGVSLGSQIELIIPNKTGEVSVIWFYLVGTYKTGLYEDDSQRVYILLENGQEATQQTFSSLQFSQPPLEDGTFTSPKVWLENLKTKLPDPDHLVYWRDRHAQYLKAVTHERQLIAIVISMIIAVSAMGIGAMQYTFVLEKFRDIGILLTLGFSRFEVFSIFIFNGLFVGLSGLLLGLLLGSVICENANHDLVFL